MKYLFHIIDVFTERPFAGNQLAVVPRAQGLSTEDMQDIAREFNFAETTFVLPATDPAAAARVRIFTPRAELKFAGHPSIGTACALVAGGHLPSKGTEDVLMVLELGVGPVTVRVKRHDGTLDGTLVFESALHRPGPAAQPVQAASALGVAESEVEETFCAGTGLDFTFVRLADAASVDRAVLDRPAWHRHFAGGPAPHVFLYAHAGGDPGRLHARMFAPALGVEEDPGTGSACAALASALAERDGSGEARIHVVQGKAMGRPCHIAAHALRVSGSNYAVSVGGRCTLFATGELVA